MTGPPHKIYPMPSAADHPTARALESAASSLQSSCEQSALVDDLTAEYCHHHAHVTEALDRHPADVVGEEDEGGGLANLEAAFKPLLVRRERAVDGVHADGRGQIHALIGPTDVTGHRLSRRRVWS